MILLVLYFFLMLAIFIEDFRHRGVTWFLFPFYFSLNLASFYFDFLSWDLINTLLSLSFLFFSLFFVYIYFRLKSKGDFIFLNKYIGVGDILFLIITSMIFEFNDFIVIYFFSLLAGIFYWIFVFIKFKSDITIPLAGIQAVIVFLFLFIAMIPAFLKG